MDRKTNKSDPLKFMIAKRELIIKALQEKGSLTKAWDSLSEDLPEIMQVTKFNTFKVYARMLKVIDNIIKEKENLEKKFGKVSQERNDALVLLSEARKENRTIEKRLGKVRQNQDAKSQKLSKITSEKERLENELGKVRQKLLKDQEKLPNFLPNSKGSGIYISVPKHVDGWGVQLKGSYYRLFKKIGGKVKWIHVGRNWDLNVAKKKIRNFPLHQTG